MSILYALPNTVYSSLGKKAAMPQKALPDDQQQPSQTDASVLIILSAKAYSSMGFGLSLLAIWFSWALPVGVLANSPRTSEDDDVLAPLRKGHRRTRSAGSRHKPKPIRRASAPLPPPPTHGMLENASGTHSHKHVSFIDSYSPSTRRSSAPPDASWVNYEGALPSPPPDSTLFSNVISSSPVSRTISLPDPLSLPTPPPERASPLPSELPRPSTAPCQSRPSGSSSPVFRKLRLSFNSKRKRVQGDGCPESSTTQSNEASPPNHKKPGTFIPPWSHSKKGPPSDPLACLETASTRSCSSFSKQSTSSKTSSTSSPSSPSFILRSKKARRTSTPIPRTMPYEAPYFATPPLILDDSYPAYLRRLPQFEDEMISSVPSESSDSSRGHDPKPQNSGSAVPSHTEPSRNVPKRRSASVDWSPRFTVSTQA